MIYWQTQSETLTAKFHGRVLWLQLDQAGQGRPREDLIRHQTRPLLLQSDVIRAQERKRYVSKADEQNVCILDYEECASLHGRHVGKEHMGGRLEQPPRDL